MTCRLTSTSITRKAFFEQQKDRLSSGQHSPYFFFARPFSRTFFAIPIIQNAMSLYAFERKKKILKNYEVEEALEASQSKQSQSGEKHTIVKCQFREFAFLL